MNFVFCTVFIVKSLDNNREVDPVQSGWDLFKSLPNSTPHLDIINVIIGSKPIYNIALLRIKPNPEMCPE
jgi:hypothetical protein